MGRVNAMPLSGSVRRPAGATRRLDWRSTPVTQARRRSLALLALGAIVWWTVASTIELAQAGSSVDGPLFIATALVTCLIGGALGRSAFDDLALAAGSVLGLVVSGVLVSIEPGGHAFGDIATTALFLGVAIVVVTPFVRRVLGSFRSS